MRVTGGLFMELFRVMVKASLNTQDREGFSSCHPWETRSPLTDGIEGLPCFFNLLSPYN